MSVDTSKIRVGDIVHIRVKVEGLIAGGINHRTHEDQTTWVGLEDIVAVEPRPLKVGDRVFRWHGTHHYRIDHIVENYAVLVDGKTPDGIKVECPPFMQALADLRLWEGK